MRLFKSVALAALVVGALGVASGTSYADPVAPGPDVINYETTLVDRTIVTTIDAGAFQIRADGRTVDILDSAGNVAVNMPLSFSVAGLSFPYLHEVSNGGKTLSLTPDVQPADARLIAQPVASLLENQRAQDSFATQFGIASAIGGFTGTIIGLIVGCLLGVGALPAILATCAGGAAVGGIIGTFIAGGPTLVIAGVDLINTLMAPPGTTKWNYPVPTK